MKGCSIRIILYTYVVVFHRIELIVCRLLYMRVACSIGVPHFVSLLDNVMGPSNSATVGSVVTVSVSLHRLQRLYRLRVNSVGELKKCLHRPYLSALAFPTLLL